MGSIKINCKKTAYVLMLMLLLCIGLDVQATHFARGVPSFSVDGGVHGKTKRTIISQIGEYQVEFSMVPAFPLPSENGTIQIKTRHLGTNKAFEGSLSLKYETAWPWLSSESEMIGRYAVKNGMARFDLQFPDIGKYVINMELIGAEKTRRLSLPLDVGKPFQSMPLILTLMIIAIALSAVRLMQFVKSRREEAV